MSRKMAKHLDRFRIVLVEPQDSGNVGSVCRAMKTMGFSKLRIVGRQRDDFDENRVRTLSLHARDLFEEAEFFDNLAVALEDVSLAAGITRRTGKFRKYVSIPPEQLAGHLASSGEGTVALVFGRESDGLTDQELDCCNLAVRIPSSELFPSLNLSHAVQVITYTLFRAYQAPSAAYEAATQHEILDVERTITQSFESIGFFKQDEKEEVGRFFRDIFSRALLSGKEAARLKKMFRKMAGIKIHRPR